MNNRYSFFTRVILLGFLFAQFIQPQFNVFAAATLTITPITWNVVGLDSNNVNVGPNHFPIGARVCNTGDAPATNLVATFVWDSANALVNNRPGTNTSLTLSSLSNVAPNNCTDFYFEVEVTRNASAYDTTRNYHIEVSATGISAVSTPTPRTLYVEHLVSQSRNAVTDVQYGASLLSLTSLPAGGTMTLMVGNTYFIKLVGYTATNGYEQLESFINFPNTIFQILSVNTTYTADTSAYVSSPNDKAYSDACLWENNPASSNYRSCLNVGKVGGNIEVTYQVKILQVPGSPLVNPEPLSTLIYDFSGSSYHYNSDFSVSTRFAHIVNATLAKSFSPKTIIPGGTSALTFTITNPGAAPISNANFIDNLPANVTISGTTVTYTNCGSPSPASLTNGATSLAFTNITVPSSAICTIAVTVTSSTNGTYNNTTGNLFLGSTDTGSSGSDTLVVSSLPAPPTSCSTLTTMATWNLTNYTAGTSTQNGPFSASSTHTNVSLATGTYGSLTGSSSGIANTTTFPTGWSAPSTTGNSNNSWGIQGAWLSSNPASLAAAATAATPYFQFQVTATGFGGVQISSRYNLQGNWSNAGNWYVLTSTDGSTWSGLNTGAWDKGNAWNPNAGGSAAISGVTTSTAATVYFRIFAAGAQYSGNPSTTTGTMYLDDIVLSGCLLPSPPTLSKSFSPATIGTGSASILTFSLANPNSGTALSGVSFTDVLPSGLTVASASSSVCGGTLTTTAPRNIAFSGGSLAASGTCTINVTVTGSVAGTHTNVSSSISSTQSGPNTTSSGFGTSTLTVIDPPVISKAFTANPIFTGNTTLLTFSINNPNSSTALAGVAFTDNLPAGLVVDTTTTAPATPATSTCGGTLTANNAATSITIASGSIASGGSCTITVRVRGTTSGLKTNSVQVSSTNGGTGNTATAPVLVKDPVPAISLLKQVGTSSSGPWLTFLTTTTGTNVYYRFLLENTGDVALTSVNVTDPSINLSGCSWTDGDGTPLTAPFNLPVADVNDNQLATCVRGPFTTTSGTTVNTATASGTYGATTVNDTSSATYQTTEPLISKSFSPVNIGLNGTSTLTLTISNPSSSTTLLGVAFTDTYPSGLQNAATPNGSTTCTGGTVTAAANGPSVNLSGASIPASGSCTVTVTVTGTSVGTKSNSVTVTSTNGGTGNTATANLYVFLAQPTKSLTSTSEAFTSLMVATERVAVGEMIRYRLATLLPEGSFTNLQLVDEVPTGLQFLDDGTAKVAFVCNGGPACLTSTTLSGAGLVVSGASSAVSPTFTLPAGAISSGPFTSGTDVTFSLGNLTNSDSDVDAEYIVLEFNALVLNANSAATINQGIDNSSSSMGSSNTNSRLNDVLLRVNGSQIGAASANVTVSVAEPAITAITKSVSPSSGPFVPGDALVYTLSFTNIASGNNATTAFDIVLTDTFSSNLMLGTVSIASPDQGATCAGSNAFTMGSFTSGQLVTATISCLDPGRTVNVTVNTTVSSGVASGTTIANSAGLTYTSLPGAQGNCATAPFTCTGIGASGSGAGERNGSGGAGADIAVLNNYVAASNTVNALVSYGSIVVTKDAVPDNAQDFAFTGSGPGGYTFGGGFSLDDDADGTLPNTRTFSDRIPGTYSLTETSLSGWSLTGLTCTDPDSGSTTTLGTGNASIDLDAGETVSCTYTNTQLIPDLTVTKSNNVSGSVAQNASFNWTITATNGDSSAAVFTTGQTIMSDTLPGAAGYYPQGTLTVTNGVTPPTGTINCTIAGTSLTCVASGGAVTLPVNASFSVTIAVTPSAAGTLSNTATVDPDSNITESNETNNTGSDSVTVLGPPSIAKSFIDATLPVGATTTLTFTVTNSNTGTALTGVAFSDALPAGLTVADSTSAQCGGTLTTTSVTGVISLTGATVPASGTCTFNVTVTGSTAGVQNNTTGNVTSTNGGTGNTASASTTVVAPPSISKNFSPDPILVSATTTLTFTITNANTAVALTGIGFTDPLPAGLEIASTPNASASAGCGSPTLTAVAGSNSFSFSGGTIAANGSCTVSVDVTATTGGVKNNTTLNIVSANGGTGNTASDTLTVSAPSFTIVKAPNVTSVNAAGNVIGYTITLTNTGTAALTGVSVADPLLADLDCDGTVGAPRVTTGFTVNIGNALTCTGSYTVTQADFDNNGGGDGDIDNTVTGDTNETPSQNASAAVTMIQNPAHTTVKTETSTGPYGVGNTITYNIVVTNTGNLTLTGVTVVDNNATVGNCIPAQPATLAPSVSITCPASHVVSQADLDNGSFVNTASGDTNQTPPSTSTVTVNFTQTPGLAIIKEVSTDNSTWNNTSVSLNVGDTVYYRVRVSNTGNITLTGLTVDDGMAGCTLSRSTDNPGDNDNNFEPDEQWIYTCSLSAVVGTNNNTASADSNQTVAVTDDASYTATVIPAPAMNVTKNGTLDMTVMAPNTQANAGDVINYTIDVQNTGNQDLTGVSVTDPLISGTLDCDGTPGAPLVTSGLTITLGNTLTCTGTYPLTQADLDNNGGGDGDIDNTVTVVSNETPDDTASRAVPLLLVPAIDVTKTLNSATFNNPNEVRLTYTVNVQNTGNVTLANIQVTDDLVAAFPGAVSFNVFSLTSATFTVNPGFEGDTDQDMLSGADTLAVGTGGSITLVVDVDTGGDEDNYVNLSTGFGTPPSGPSVQDDGQAGAPSFVDPALTKAVDVVQASVGDPVTFTITVSNAGNVPAPDVQVIDALPAMFDVTAVNVSSNNVVLQGATVITINPPVGGAAPFTVTVDIGGPAGVGNIPLGVTDVVTIQIVTVVNSLGNPPIVNNAALTTTAPTNNLLNDADNVTITISAPGFGGGNDPALPATGFTPDVVTQLTAQPEELQYTATDVWLEIPSLGVKMPVVGVPLKKGGWDVSWLANQAGWLEGSAFPSWKGNSVLTGHVTSSSGLPGPFANLNKLKYGDKVIVHLGRQKYIFEIRTNQVLSPNDTSAYKHEVKPWITLITCNEYDPGTNTYKKRVVVRAVLIEVE